MSTQTEKESTGEEVVESPEIDFKPIVNLPLIDTSTLEENEEELIKLRAKLFRFECASDPPEWKERGIGEVKIMSNKNTGNYRVIMRRDKTHKICANHLINPDMKLLPSAGSDRAWVWTVPADFADEEPKKEQLAIRFRNSEIAQKFKGEFENCQKVLSEKDVSAAAGTNGITEELEKLAVTDKDTPTNGAEEGVASNESHGNNDEEPKPVQDEDTPPEETKTEPASDTA